MPNFQYEARAAGGGLYKGTIAAPSYSAVVSLLRDKKVTPIRIIQLEEGGEGTEQPSLLARLPSLCSRRLKPDELILFCQQMGTLLKAGVPIVRALKGMIEMASNQKFAQALSEVVHDIEAGREVNVAMRQQPKIFPPILISMIKVGESSGHLDDAFLQVGQYIEQEKKTIDQVKSALRYPSFVAIAMAGAITVISLYVVPAFEKIFTNSRIELPLATRILMAVSRFSQAYWPFILSGVVGVIFWFNHYKESQKGKFVWGRIKLRLPIIGSILLRATLTRFSRALAMGLTSGVAMVESLRLAGMAVDNAWVQAKVEGMCSNIERGETLTHSATKLQLFTPLVLQMLAIGEETGMLDKMLVDVAGFYEREVDHEVKNLTSAIEPILIVFMGVMVMILAFGVFLPMWNLSTAIKR